MKIHLKLNGKAIPATLADNRTARAFAAMLPLTITMHDLFGREKFGPLPNAIAGGGTQTAAYEVGDMVCWTAGPDMSIFHRQDGQPLSGGWQILGRLDSGAQAFGVPGPRGGDHRSAGRRSGGRRSSRARCGMCMPFRPLRAPLRSPRPGRPFLNRSRPRSPRPPGRPRAR